MKNNLFLGFSLITHLILEINAQTERNCLYCKQVDTYTSFLYTYSYCQSLDTCLMDEMNYVNKWCPSRWVPGWMIDIDLDCHAEPPSRPCNSFTSSQSYYG